MKHLLTTTVFLSLFALSACTDYRDADVITYDFGAPLPPTGITTVSLDNEVEIKWTPNQEPDVAGYNVYVSSSYNGRYSLIGNSRTNVFVDNGARNGTTYYYAVTAYDFSGNESELSKDVAYDTPRPEGYGVILSNRFVDPFRSGYDFSEYRVVAFDAQTADFFVEFNATGVPFLVVYSDTDIQDMGHTQNLDEITAAPEGGWNPTKDALAVVGHTYVIWTTSNNFAKVRIVQITQSAVVFDWAYQTASGNPELKPVIKKRDSSTVNGRPRPEAK